MGRRSRDRKKEKRKEKRKNSRNAQRRRDYPKINAEERKNPGVERKDEAKSRKIRDDIRDAYRQADRYSGFSFFPGISYRLSESERREKEFERAVDLSKSVILCVGKHATIGEVYEWGLEHERSIKKPFQSFVYWIDGQFVAQLPGTSYIFHEGHYPSDKRDNILYNEARKRSGSFAQKHKKNLVDETGKGPRVTEPKPVQQKKKDVCEILDDLKKKEEEEWQRRNRW